MTVKLEKEMLESVDNHCEGLGCSRTDFIIEAVQEKLEGKTESKDIQEPKSVESETIKVTVLPEPREFRCEKGNLLENDIVVGDCADYGIDNGKVFQNGIQIGIIKPSNLMTNVVVEN